MIILRTIILCLLAFNLFANENIALQFAGVNVKHMHANSIEEIKVERIQPKECIDVHANPETIYGGDIAASSVPLTCKKTFVSTVGKIQPMQIAEGIKTVGEIEVLDFLKNKFMKEPQSYVLVDSRRPNWFEISTIPGAVNIPYDEMTYDVDFEEDFARMLHILNIKKVGKKYDFSHVKTALLFCNASWCGQSPQAIRILLDMGYPRDKILWFRGGLQDWILSGFNTITPK
jgi:rhodanese-related sulfurtransferase